VFYRISFVEKEVSDDRILHEVPEKGGDQESQEDHHEEQEAGDSGRMPEVQHQGVPHRRLTDSQSVSKVIRVGAAVL